MYPWPLGYAYNYLVMEWDRLVGIILQMLFYSESLHAQSLHAQSLHAQSLHARLQFQLQSLHAQFLHAQSLHARLPYKWIYWRVEYLAICLKKQCWRHFNLAK